MWIPDVIPLCRCRQPRQQEGKGPASGSSGLSSLAQVRLGREVKQFVAEEISRIQAPTSASWDWDWEVAGTTGLP